MKVHILWYDYYEDSGIVGIYTEEGKKKKIAEIQAEACGFYQNLKDDLEKELQELKSIRRTHLEKVNEAIEFYKAHPDDKNAKKRKRDLICFLILLVVC
jgi:site-specific DNA-adenine methylase